MDMRTVQHHVTLSYIVPIASRYNTEQGRTVRELKFVQRERCLTHFTVLRAMLLMTL